MNPTTQVTVSSAARNTADKESNLHDGRYSIPITVEVMGLPIDAYTSRELIKRVLVDSTAGVGGYVMTPNLDNLRSLNRDHELMARAQAADVRVADGMPLIWASRIQRTPLPGRVAGSDLILALAAASADAGKRVFLLGGEPGIAEQAADELRLKSPGLNVVGTYCPPHGYESNPDEMTRIQSVLLAARPDFVFVGLPFPKASALVGDLRHVLPQTWFVGLGVSFSFVCGDVPRAPSWMQQAGLEWVHRLRQEPRRLARRYLLEGVPFALLLLWTSLRKRREIAGAATDTVRHAT